MIDTGPIMRKMHKLSGFNGTIEDWVFKLEQRYGKNVTSIIITKQIKKILLEKNYQSAIIIGFRTIESIEYVVSQLQPKNFAILFIDAPYELLYKNYLNRENKVISFNDFKIYLDKELESGLKTLKYLAVTESENFNYFYRKSNDESFENLILDYLKQDVKILNKKKLIP